MPFGATIRTNRGLISIADVIPLKLLDERIVFLGADRNNNGSFTVPLVDCLTFNDASSFNVFAFAALDSDVPQPSIMALSSLTTFVDFPSIIRANSLASVNFRGGRRGNYRFFTWITETP